MFGATFGYAAGWNPYASDYTRYLAPDTRKAPVAIYAGLGVFLSCIAARDHRCGGGHRRRHRGRAVRVHRRCSRPGSASSSLACICIGAVAANAINIYSGSVSFMALGIRLPTHAARAAVAVAFGIIGLLVAFGGLNNAGQGLRELPADHRVLDRAVARRRVRRPVPAARAGHPGVAGRQALHELGRPDRHARRRRVVDLAVRGADRLHRPDRQGPSRPSAT